MRVNACPQLPLVQPACGGQTAGLGGSTSNGRSVDQLQQPWLLCVQRNELDLWQLGSAGQPAVLGAPAEGILLPSSAPPQHLLRLVLQSGRHAIAACICSSGRWLAYSDIQGVSCFALEEQPANDLVPDAHVVPAPVQLPGDLPPACHLAFRPGTTELVACSSDGVLRLVNVAACQQQQATAGTAGKCSSSTGTASGATMQTLRAVSDLHYKSSLRRDRQRSAARRLLPLVELMAVSPDGWWV